MQPCRRSAWYRQNVNRLHEEASISVIINFMARLLTRIILSYRRGKHHLPFHNSHCLQFPDRRYDIRLLCHDLIDILVSKPALLGHIILLPLAEDNSLLFQVHDYLFRRKRIHCTGSGISPAGAV